MSQRAVSIIIPNYNGEPIIAATLRKLLSAVTPDRHDCDLVVVDDASTDSSVELIQNRFPRVRLIRHTTNQGFAKAVHSGVRAARHGDLILLNSDVHPQPGFIAPLLAALTDNKVFAASPLVLDNSGNPLFLSWSRYKIRHGKLRNIAWNLAQAQQLSRSGIPLRSLYTSGGSMAVRRDRFLELGGFLPIYEPYYWEDVDLGMRAWLRGWESRFVPESRVVHDDVGTIKRLHQRHQVRIVQLRNRLTFLYLYSAPGRFYSGELPWILLRSLTHALRLDPNHFVALLKFLSLLPQLNALRHNLMGQAAEITLQSVLDDISRCSSVEDGDQPFHQGASPKASR